MSMERVDVYKVDCYKCPEESVIYVTRDQNIDLALEEAGWCRYHATYSDDETLCPSCKCEYEKKYGC